MKFRWDVTTSRLNEVFSKAITSRKTRFWTEFLPVHWDCRRKLQPRSIEYLRASNVSQQHAIVLHPLFIRSSITQYSSWMDRGEPEWSFLDLRVLNREVKKYPNLVLYCYARGLDWLIDHVSVKCKNPILSAHPVSVRTPEKIYLLYSLQLQTLSLTDIHFSIRRGGTCLGLLPYLFFFTRRTILTCH